MAECWFDVRTGDLLVGAAAASERLEQSSPGDVVPLAELLTDEVFPYGRGDFEQPPRKSWTREELVSLGYWVVNILNDGNDEVTEPLLFEHFQRLRILGIGPSFKNQKVFRNIAEYREAIGLERGKANGYYDIWTIKDFTVHALKLSKSLGRKPGFRDYKAADGPSIAVISSRIPGGISGLNELIGYPNIAHWEAEDYIQWGVRVMRANNGKSITYSQFDELAKVQKGPSTYPIRARFPSWSYYKDRVEEEFNRLQAEESTSRKTKLHEYHSLIARGELPLQAKVLPDDELLHLGAKYILLRRVLASRPDAKNIAGTLAHLPASQLLGRVRRYADTNAAVFETEAEVLGVFEDIWPMDEFDEALQVA